MNTRCFPAAALLVATLALACGEAIACGEGKFNMGQGLRYQGYLAPRPATVLVLDAGTPDRKALYAGLQKAGHTVTIVDDAASLAQAMRAGRYDVVITDFEQLPAIEAGTADRATTRLLPVVERSRRNAPEVRSRFNLFLLDGASLGQYLKSIDQLVRGARR